MKNPWVSSLQVVSWGDVGNVQNIWFQSFEEGERLAKGDSGYGSAISAHHYNG